MVSLASSSPGQDGGERKWKLLVRLDKHGFTLDEEGITGILSVVEKNGLDMIAFVSSVYSDRKYSCRQYMCTPQVLRSTVGLSGNNYIASTNVNVEAEDDKCGVLFCTAINVRKVEERKLGYIFLDIRAPSIYVEDKDVYSLLLDFCIMVSSDFRLVYDMTEKDEEIWPVGLSAISSRTSHISGGKKRIKIVLRPFEEQGQKELEFEKLRNSTETFNSLKTRIFIKYYWPEAIIWTVGHGENVEIAVPILNPSDVSSPNYHLYSNPTKDVEKMLRQAVFSCNSPLEPPNFFSPRTDNVPDGAAEDAIGKYILDKYLIQFESRVALWEKVFFLDRFMLVRQFQLFAQDFAEVSLDGCKLLHPSVTTSSLTNIIFKVFNERFQIFVEKYLSSQKPFNACEAEIKIKLRKIETEIREAYRKGRESLDSFIQGIPAAYTLVLAASVYLPSANAQLLPQWQLRIHRMVDIHKKCILSAGEGIKKIQDTLQRGFQQLFLNPCRVGVGVPAKPRIQDIPGAFHGLSSLKSFLETVISEEHGLKVSKFLHLTLRIKQELRNEEKRRRVELCSEFK